MAQTLRPLTVGELLDRTFFYYRRHFVLFVGISAVPNVLVLAFQLALVFARPAAAGPLLTALFGLVALVVYLVTATLAHGATVVAVSQIILARDTQVAEAFNSIRPRVGQLIAISLNVGVRVMLGALLLVVPGILLALRYSLAIPVAVLEHTGVHDSMSRSVTLTKGHRLRILLIYVLLFVLIIIASMLWPFLTLLATGGFASAARGQSPAWTEVVIQFGNFVTQSLLAPIMTIALTLVYYDERVRKEAFDLDHMMQQLETVVIPPPPPA